MKNTKVAKRATKAENAFWPGEGAPRPTNRDRLGNIICQYAIICLSRSRIDGREYPHSLIPWSYWRKGLLRQRIIVKDPLKGDEVIIQAH